MTRAFEVATAILVPVWAAAAWKAAVVTSPWWGLLAVPLTALAVCVLAAGVIWLQGRSA